jgi:F-type H+-transporting ATPase subunit b
MFKRFLAVHGPADYVSGTLRVPLDVSEDLHPTAHRVCRIQLGRERLHRFLYGSPVFAIATAIASPAWASGGESAGSEAMNPLAPPNWQLDLALWTAVVFVCLAAVLYKFAWGPLAAALDKRERGIADQIADAEAANQKAKDLLADYERKLDDAKTEVRGIVEQGRRDAEKLGRDLLDKAREEAAAEHARAVQEIDAAADAAAKGLADHSAALAVELAGKIVAAKLTTAEHAKLIEQAVGGFAARKTDASRN